MTDRQIESAAKFLYDMAKGVGLIAVVGGLVSGQSSSTSVGLSIVATVALYAAAFWLEGKLES